MKVVFTFILSLIFAVNVFATAIKQTGNLIQCKTKMDVVSKNFGYDLWEPKVQIIGKKVNLNLKYFVVNCTENNGNIGFTLPVKTNSGDRILLQSPHFFSVDTFTSALPVKSVGSIEIQASVNSILSKSEAQRYENGEVITKKLTLHYGKFLGGDDVESARNYILSGGFFELDIELQNDQANLLSFTSNYYL